MSITVTEALSKLKLTTKKIEDGNARVFVGMVATKGSNAVPAGFKSTEQYKGEAKARLDSVKGLIEYRDKLKRAIVDANARTKVTIGKTSMSVAEAIETKHAIAHKKALLAKLVVEQTNLENAVNRSNSNLDARCDEYVTKVFQSVPASDDERKKVREAWMSANTAYIISHDSVKEVIDGLKDEIDNFESNVDVALSVVNAQTQIEV